MLCGLICSAAALLRRERAERCERLWSHCAWACPADELDRVLAQWKAHTLRVTVLLPPSLAGARGGEGGSDDNVGDGGGGGDAAAVAAAVPDPFAAGGELPLAAAQRAELGVRGGTVALQDALELDQLVAGIFAPATQPAVASAAAAAAAGAAEGGEGGEGGGASADTALERLVHQDLLAAAGLRARHAVLPLAPSAAAAPAPPAAATDAVVLRDNALLRLVADTCATDAELCLSYVVALTKVRPSHCDALFRGREQTENGMSLMFGWKGQRASSRRAVVRLRSRCRLTWPSNACWPPMRPADEVAPALECCSLFVFR